MKLPILQDTTLGCCVSRCRCYEGLECLFIGTSIATKGTFGLPDSEDESSTNVWNIPTWWQSVIYQKTRIFSKTWCSVVFWLLRHSCIMNVLEIAYNCFLIDYRTCIWGFVSSGMLKWRQVQGMALNHSESALWHHPEGSIWHRKSHHLSMKSMYSQKNFMNKNVVSHPRKQ